MYVVHANAPPDRIGEQLHEKESRTDWMYLGRQFLRMLLWQRSVGHWGNRIQYADRLQELGLKWRGAYLEWIAEQARKHDGLAWWSSRVGERNTMLDSLYHAICYLRISLEAITRRERPLLIVAESHAVLLALEGCLGGNRVAWLSPRPGLVELGEQWRRHADRTWAQYLSSAQTTLKAAHDTRGARAALPEFAPGKKRVLLHSCLDDSYFGNDGQAHERYFPGLIPRLEKLGSEVVTMPWLYNIAKPVEEAFAWFRQRGSAYLIPEDFYTLEDYVWAAGVIRSQAALMTGAQFFQNMNITELVSEAQWRQSCDTDLSKYVRYYRLFEKLAGLGFQFDLFVDTFENMITEKPQVMAIRKWMPGVQTVGYQHYLAVFPLMLCFFTTRSEAEFAPHPDVIVCNSPMAMEQMEACGFPRQKLRLGPSLRYQHLLQTPDFKRSTEKRILVVLPLDPDACFELMIAVLSVSARLPDCLFLIKPHPMMAAATVQSLLSNSTLPTNVKVTSDSLNEGCSRAAAVLVTASTGALEVALTGTPVMVYGRELDFDLNPLAWFDEFNPPLRSTEALHEAIADILTQSDRHSRRNVEWARDVRCRMVSPVNDATIAAFLE